MFNSDKIKQLENKIFYLEGELKYSKEQQLCNQRAIDRLDFLLANPLKWKVGDSPFKDIVITSINYEYKAKGISYDFYQFKCWQWEIKAFDSKNKREVYLQLDCGNNLINPNK